jgi:predicted amidohydrolase YtcJ
VHEAGISYPDIALFKKLIDRYNFKINLYAMLMPEKKNLDFIQKNGHYIYKNLTIRSIKVIGDGALGSRGALLKHPYEDAHNHHGLLTTPIDKMKEIAAFCLAHNYQMNTHAIGDSTVRILLDVYAKAYQKNRDHRWRIEHAQVVDPKDIDFFGKYAIFPSVQPTHAVSDQRWAEQRLGKSRMKGAYAYQSLLQQYGMLALGTDFPIELTDPFLTIHAAVKRKNAGNQPASGFYSNEALTLTECLRGMTIWPAFAAFQENHLGSLEKGKDATFVIWDKPIRSDEDYSPNFSRGTFIKGEKVYSVD